MCMYTYFLSPGDPAFDTVFGAYAFLYSFSFQLVLNTDLTTQLLYVWNIISVSLSGAVFEKLQ